MTATSAPILCVLPPREGFSPDAFGAVSLSVKDFTEHSRYRDRTVILGQVKAAPYAGLNYEALQVKRQWHERGTQAYARSIAARAATLQPALIEVHNRPLLALKLRKQVSAPIVLHLHNDPQDMASAKTVRQRAKLLQKLDGIYCVSEWTKKRFLQGLPDSFAHKVFAVPCGVHTPKKPAEKHPQILYVGRMTPNKGVLEFTEGLAAAVERHPSWQGILIGGRRHSASEKLSDYERQIMRIVSTYTNIEHRGFQPFEVAQRAFKNASIVVVPSLWEEPFGRTTLEAMSYGCAVISSGRGGQMEIMGETGVVLKEVNDTTIARAIDKLIENEDTRHAMQDAAYERAKKFSVEACAATLDNARQQILNEETRHVA